MRLIGKLTISTAMFNSWLLNYLTVAVKMGDFSDFTRLLPTSAIHGGQLPGKEVLIQHHSKIFPLRTMSHLHWGSSRNYLRILLYSLSMAIGPGGLTDPTACCPVAWLAMNGGALCHVRGKPSQLVAEDYSMSQWLFQEVHIPGLVKVYKKLRKITMFHGKTHYFGWAIFKFANCNKSSEHVCHHIS